MKRSLVAASGLALAAGILTAIRPGAGAGAPQPSDAAPGDRITAFIASHRHVEAEREARALLARAQVGGGPRSAQAAEAHEFVALSLTRGDLELLPEARSHSQRAIEIREEIFGPDHSEVAYSLGRCVNVLWGFEQYEAALPLAERALAILTRAAGADSPELAGPCYQLSGVLRALGEYGRAKKLQQRALAIWERSRGPEDPEVAAALHYLGVLHMNTGDFAAARQQITRALSIREKKLGPRNELVAASLNALAELAARQGDRAAALGMYERARGIWEESLGRDHPFVARSLGDGGLLLSEMGDRTGARRAFERALAIREKAFGPDHYLVARSLVQLANLHADAGEASETSAAEKLFQRALRIQETSLGAAQPEYASSLADHARLLWSTGDSARALADSLRAETLARRYFQRTSRGLTEIEALRYESVRTSGLDVALSVTISSRSQANPAESRSAASRTFDAVIRSRAMVLDAMASRHQSRGADKEPESERGGGEDGAGLSGVAAALPGSTALIAYVKFNRLEENQGRRGRAWYLAFVLHEGDASPAVIPLGDAERIEGSARAWWAQASSDPRLRPHDRPDQAYREAGARLREAIWDPIVSALGGARLVFVVPDGAIGLVSLAALPAPEDRFLVEVGPLLHYLSAERDLLISGAARATGQGVLAVGDPDFDALPRAAPGSSGTIGSAGREPSSPMPGCRELAELTFEPLPGARAEAEEVAALWSGRAEVRTLLGGGAGEASFRREVRGRRLLHLATHAYFLQDRCGATLAASRDLDQSPVAGDSPLVLSGLAMAGANRRDVEAPGAHEEDGILTAEEIAALDLSGVEWAVLSACDTGLGMMVDGEGALGLSRAFQAAGARTLIMSRWAVEDGAARVWMRRLYEARLAGLGTAASARTASLEMIRRQRERGRTTHPFFWGGWVATGDWR